MAISMGSFTIVDMNDARQLNLYIQANLPKYQILNPDNGSVSNSWESTNLVLTPELYVTGTAGDIITTSSVQTVKWYKDTETTAIVSGTDYVLSGTKNHILTIKKNVLTPSKNTIDFVCEIQYKDPTTELITTSKSSISFALLSSGGGITDALASTPNGNIFKNNDIASLTGECVLWRGSQQDITNISVQWYAQDSTVTTDQGGGKGWKKLSNTTGKYTGVTTSTITIYPDAVTNVQTFKCIITDIDSTSTTYNQKFEDYITIVDLQDPFSVVISSTGGNIFKEGQGSTDLTARLFQAGNEVDTAGTKYTYKWFKYDKNATLVTDWGGTGVDYKTGKTITIGSNDVDVKATFEVSVE